VSVPSFHRCTLGSGSLRGEAAVPPTAQRPHVIPSTAIRVRNPNIKPKPPKNSAARLDPYLAGYQLHCTEAHFGVAFAL
jgi:hypothetical protein